MRIIEQTEVVKIKYGFQESVLQLLNRPSKEAHGVSS